MTHNSDQEMPDRLFKESSRVRESDVNGGQEPRDSGDEVRFVRSLPQVDYC